MSFSAMQLAQSNMISASPLKIDILQVIATLLLTRIRSMPPTFQADCRSLSA
jgi:hypothetical protein